MLSGRWVGISKMVFGLRIVESAHKSTGFSGPGILPNLEGDNAMLAEASLPLYRSLLKFAI